MILYGLPRTKWVPLEGVINLVLHGVYVTRHTALWGDIVNAKPAPRGSLFYGAEQAEKRIARAEKKIVHADGDVRDELQKKKMRYYGRKEDRLRDFVRHLADAVLAGEIPVRGPRKRDRNNVLRALSRGWNGFAAWRDAEVRRVEFAAWFAKAYPCRAALVAEPAVEMDWIEEKPSPKTGALLVAAAHRNSAGGRPASRFWSFIKAEFQRHVEGKRLARTVSGEARYLAGLLGEKCPKEHPAEKYPAVGTIENKIRERHREYFSTK